MQKEELGRASVPQYVCEPTSNIFSGEAQTLDFLAWSGAVREQPIFVQAQAERREAWKPFLHGGGGRASNRKTGVGPYPGLF